MGDMADYYIELGQNQGWSPFGSSRTGFPRKTNQHDVTCRKCGAVRLKWRETVSGWRLFEETRGEHNEKLEHQCEKATASDFEVLS